MNIQTVNRYYQRFKTLEERFWEKVDKRSDDECWEWKNCKTHFGYGKIKVGKQYKPAHRVMWELYYGSVPDGMLVLHKCDNPPCVNPKHLFLGTYLDNVRDMIAKDRVKYVRGEQHGHAKFKDGDIRNIRQLYKDGQYSQYKLAEMYNVCTREIRKIVHNELWKHIK